MRISAHIHGLADRYLSFLDKMSNVVWGISISLFILLTVLTVGSVISRSILNFVPAWSGELQRYIGIWMTLLLVGPLIYSNNHFALRLIDNRVSGRALSVIRSVHLVIILIIGISLINWGTEYVLVSGTASTSATLPVQMLWIYLIIPITGWLIVLFTTGRMIQLKRTGADMSGGYETVDEDLHEGDI